MLTQQCFSVQLLYMHEMRALSVYRSDKNCSPFNDRKEDCVNVSVYCIANTVCLKNSLLVVLKKVQYSSYINTNLEVCLGTELHDVTDHLWLMTFPSCSNFKFP